MAVLDTTVLVDLGRGRGSPAHAGAIAAVGSRVRAGELLYVPRPAEAEFRVGSFRARDPVVETARIEHILSGFAVVELDGQAALHFARCKAHLLGIGRPSGDMDVLIAAIALANGEPLLTRNPGHFADIPGLVVESY